MNCRQCEHCLFDPLWGEFKCIKRRTILYVLLHAEECSDFDESKTKELKIAKQNLKTEGSY